MNLESLIVGEMQRFAPMIILLMQKTVYIITMKTCFRVIQSRVKREPRHFPEFVAGWDRADFTGEQSPGGDHLVGKPVLQISFFFRHSRENSPLLSEISCPEYIRRLKLIQIQLEGCIVQYTMFSALYTTCNI